MLGEDVGSVEVDERGVDGDRRLALLDVETGRVATAKHPRLWRSLLSYAASGGPGAVRITLPDGRTVAAGDDGIDDLLSGLLGRAVRLAAERPPGAQVERPAPEDVLEHGVDAEVDFEILEISQGAPGATFVDYAPLHLITTATLDRIGVEAIRYRPNVVVATHAGCPAFAENEWVGRELRIGEVRARGSLPTPRCSVPTLEHGGLPREPQALRPLLGGNRVEVPGFGVLPCAGVYLEVIDGGTIREGDEVVLR
ncbi:MOSC domain-containing protein [Pseudonocardia sp. K10HN5]|uniref:MOSC domain-containing protein n=2 Tax=Pseudonocardia acidicola TaxID=2724939 RepID=A0ABX1S6P8_9PSEU|nr:MOSC domain-containing protein [Pseudonocardia acidicola]